MISWEQPAKKIMQLLFRPRLKDRKQLNRFEEISMQYPEICRRLLGDSSGSCVSMGGYEWGTWAGQVRQSFHHGVPLDFLHHSTLTQTMVFSRKKGISITEKLARNIQNTFGAQATEILLREDYIGLPTITNLRYMTSAQRAHHANHLSSYTRATQNAFWDNQHIVEWGGGYGNMARIIRRMNPSVTYTIIDLPELLALQYIYLTSLEGKNRVHIINPGDDISVSPGVINLIPSQYLLESKENILSCDGFVSTWGLTESPKNAQMYVHKHAYFGASMILLASICDRNNVLSEMISEVSFQRIPVSILSGKGKHEYWFEAPNPSQETSQNRIQRPPCAPCRTGSGSKLNLFSME